MIDESLLQRTLGAALRSGGDFAEVFVEDRRSSSAHLDDGRDWSPWTEREARRMQRSFRFQ